MAQPTITSNFWGDVVEELMTLAVTQNDIVDGGHIYVDDNIVKQRAVVRARQSNIIQDVAATPTSQGTQSFDERVIKPDDFMVYIEFDPNNYRNIWEKWHPKGDFVFTQLNPQVQAELLRLLLEGEGGVDNYMGNAILNGNKVAGIAPLNKFNGLIYKAQNDPDVVSIPAPVAITGGAGGNVRDKLELIYQASRVPVRDNPDFKFYMSTVDFDKYRSYLEALPNKSIDPTVDAPKMYHGRKIVVLPTMPENKVFATVGNPKRTSNIWMGVKGVADFSNIKVAQLQANSDLWFFKMKMSADTQIKFGQDLVLYNA